MLMLLNLSCSQEAEHIDVVPHAVVGFARDFGGEVIAERVVGLDKCTIKHVAKRQRHINHWLTKYCRLFPSIDRLRQKKTSTRERQKKRKVAYR